MKMSTKVNIVVKRDNDKALGIWTTPVNDIELVTILLYAEIARSIEALTVGDELLEYSMLTWMAELEGNDRPDMGVVVSESAFHSLIDTYPELKSKIWSE